MTIPRAGQPEEILAWQTTLTVYVLDARAQWSLFREVSLVLVLKLFFLILF